jgi:rhodanese-related sulfurtransferase
MPDIKSVDPITLQTWINNKETLVIDVREPVEFQTAHIAETINIPLSSLETDIYDVEAVGSKKIVMVCQAGVRSMAACLRLKQLDDAFDSWNLEGGINEWHMNGLPLVRL